ncbi:hypothetical protein NQ315_014796 [Exocentrus adspersus]|uniref:Integrase zinc-binding domain-containing protein n=1 Tax=Exocentrus adspersus TaxID=1586481 RepID=A0AAV8VLY0_9CUCU|nr:hypothetical protein NQ315_014796 [Exocentrus adspersus]
MYVDDLVSSIPSSNSAISLYHQLVELFYRGGFQAAQIQLWTDISSWFHIQGKNNISDCLSRGLTPLQFISYTLWKSGPDWLKLCPAEWPISTVVEEEYLPESKVVSLIAVEDINNNPLVVLIRRHSKWIKLLKSMVYVVRFLKLLPNMVSISVSDLGVAELTLIKIIQHLHFKSEIHLLREDNFPSSLKHLRPFLKDDIIRVGGRLCNSNLNFDTQHPVLLPKRDPLVDLLIDHYHSSNLHTGPNLVLSLLRLRYWILSARSVVRYRIQNCNTCFRLKPKPQIPLMGNLPTCRVQESKLFLRTGCDYVGVIERIYPGRDNIIRVVDVRTKYGTYKRPVNKVCPLPVQ